MCSCCHAAALLDYSLGSIPAARFRLSTKGERDTIPQRHSGKARSFFFFVFIRLRNDSHRKCVSDVRREIRVRLMRR